MQFSDSKFMKKAILILLFTFTIRSLNAQINNTNGAFYLAGTIIGKDTGLISLNYINKAGEFAHDTVTIEKEKFTFTGFIKHPVLAWLDDVPTIQHDDNPETVAIFLEPSHMNLKLNIHNFKKIKLTGSVSHIEIEKLNKKEKPVLKRKNRLQKKYRTIKNKYTSHPADTHLQESAALIKNKIEKGKDELMHIDCDFISKHSDSYVSAYQLQYYVDELSLDSLKNLYNKFTSAVRSSVYGRVISNYINGSVGSIAKDFVIEDITGETVSLSSNRGKNYVLLDFWASWCGPCRANNPHLKDLYKQYHTAGLEMIGISLDDNKQAWEQTVFQDSIGIWRQVFAGRVKENWFMDDNDICNKYGVHPIPTMILIDKAGIIIGRYEGDDIKLLKEQLAKIFE